VPRPRLDTALVRGVGHSLTLVSAPAGSGKTVAVSAWVAGRAARADPDAAIGWVSFEAGDDRPSIFWPLILACLGRQGLRLPAEAAGAGRGSRQLLSALGAEIAALDAPLTLVLDGYEVADHQLAAGLEFLLAHSGGRLSLVIISRADPTLPLQRLSLSEDLTQVRFADLAWTRTETEQLLARSRIQLRPESVEALVARVGGWTAGLRFAAMILEHSPDPDADAARINGASGNIAEYLMSEILAAQPDEVRDVLLRTSVVDTLQPGLIEEIGGRSAARTLAGLSHANVLVEEVACAPGWYRYHPFFRELLCAELAYASPTRLASLQRRASRWYAERGVVAEIAEDAGPIGALRVRPSGAEPDGVADRATADGTRPARPAPARPVPARPQPVPDGYVVEPLTRKEREVLGLLSELLSTEEIAAAMFVSVNTVRTHVRNILRKLAVNRRNEAVRRARALDLLGS